MRPCDTAVAAAQTIATTAPQRRAAPARPLPHRFRRQRRLPAASARSGSTTTPRPTRAPSGWRAATAGGGSTTSTSPGTNPDQGVASPIWGAYWRVTGAGRLRQRRPVRRRPRRRRAPRPLAAARRAPTRFQLWLRDEAGNDAPPTAVDVPLRFDDVPPGVAFAADTGPGLPDSVSADVYDEHSARPAARSATAASAPTPGPTCRPRFVRGEAPGRAQLVARLPESLRARHLPLPRRGGRRRRQRGLDHAARRRDRDDAAQAAAAPPTSPARAAEASRPRRAARRGSSPACAGTGDGAPAVTVPFGAAAVLSGRLLDAEGAGPRRPAPAGGRAALAGRGRADPRRGVARPGEHGGFRLELPRRALAPDRGRLPRRGAARARRGARRSRCGCAAASSSTRHPPRCGPARRFGFWGRVRAQGAPIPRRGKLVAIQYLEAATGRWRPVLVTRSDHSGHFRARYRFRYVSGTARIRLRAVALSEERWPYVPGASRSLAVRVSG